MQCKRVSLLFLVTLALGYLVTASNVWAVEKVLHLFQGSDGVAPRGGLIFDVAGNLYGTTSNGGEMDQGVVFKLSPNPNGSWTESVLYMFTGGNDGSHPSAGLISDAAGNLYGTAANGGAGGSGTVFELSPGANDVWTETVLHSFSGSDGAVPVGRLIFDSAGNLYGTTNGGGRLSYGVVFKLAPGTSGQWTETVLHSFNYSDGANPLSVLVFDSAGNLYGTTGAGGSDSYGVVFKLTPDAKGGWSESVIHVFNSLNGAIPISGGTFDNAGNLYGTTSQGSNSACNAPQGCGNVFKLTPGSNGGWTWAVIDVFNGRNGNYPQGDLIFDAAGNLYGTTSFGGKPGCTIGCGVVFKLTPGTNGKWTESVLFDFSGWNGSAPSGSLTFDGAGNLYGVASSGGDTTPTVCTTNQGCGVVFEITP